MKQELLYKNISGDIRDRIERGEWEAGTRLPTVGELRERFNVSHLTVLRAFRDLQEQNMIVSRGRRFYVRSSGPIPSGTKISSIGVLTRSLREYSVCDNFFNDINFGIESGCSENNIVTLRIPQCRLLNAFPSISDCSFAEIVRGAERLETADALILDCRLPDPVIAEILKVRPIPAVIVNRDSRLDLPSVKFDNAGAVRLLIDTATRLGYRNFIFCRDCSLEPHNREREEAFDALLPDDAHRRVVRDCSIHTCEEVIPELTAAIDELLPTGKTALISSSDAYAREALNQLTRRKYLPDPRIGIAGIGGLGWAYHFSPRLCTVNVGNVELGRMAVETLLCGRSETNSISPKITLEWGETL